jgi:uncharacterized membrane protein HdeD (DUF308 family)
MSRGLAEANGVITALLGIAIWLQWPASSLWVIGMLVGTDLIVNGVTWSVLAFGVRKGLARFIGR